MEVKCPKCRYRFDTAASPGIKELACVCPRCGTPFNYVIPEDAPVEEPKPIVKDNLLEGKQPSFTPQTTVKSDVKGHLLQSEQPAAPEKKPERQEKPHQQPFEESPLRMNGNPIPAGKNRSGCGLKGCILLLVLFVLFIVFLIRSCSSEKSYTSSNVAETTTVEDGDTADEDSIDTGVKEDDAKPTPSWVFGKWQTKTEYGVIRVHISDKWISETSEGGTCHGTFFYTRGQLNCSFPDKDREVKCYYKLDEERHRIDAGDGMWMKKISDN
jgi:hypothetical protein